MAHGITESDGLVLHQKKAWHGLGTVVEEAPTPREALEIAGLDWKVNQTEGIRGSDMHGNVFHSNSWSMNVRSDNSVVLGCVTKGYCPVQNKEMADFCAELADDEKEVKVESAGSLYGGRKVFYLLKGDMFDVIDGSDPIQPYVLVSNGHDGLTAFTARTTSIRVVCNNTLSWALGQKKKDSKVFSFKHTRNIHDHIGEAKEKIKGFQEGSKQFQDKLQMMHRVGELSKDQVIKYFTDSWEVVNGKLGTAPVSKYAITEKEKFDARVNRMQGDVVVMGRMLDEEMDKLNTVPTPWTAFNATSAWVQNRYTRRKTTYASEGDSNDAKDARNNSLLFGAAEANTNKLFSNAFEFAKTI